MSKFNKLIWKRIFLGIGILATSCVVVVPSIIYTNSNQKINSESNHVNLTENNSQLNNEYEKDISKVKEQNVLNILNKSFATQSMMLISNSTVKSQNQKKIILAKEDTAVKEIYAHKININVEIKELKNKYYNNLTPSQKEFIQQKIANSKKIEEKKLAQKELKNNQTHLMYISNIEMFQQDQLGSAVSNATLELRNEKATLNKDASNMKLFAGLSTAAAIASTAISIAICCIPFWGWVEDAFAVADTCADWGASITAWVAYAAINKSANLSQNVISTFSYIWDGTGSYYLCKNPWDTWDKLNESLSSVNNDAVSLEGITVSDEAVNDASVACEPEVVPWYVPAIEAANLLVDDLSYSVGVASQIIGNQIVNIQDLLEDQNN